MKIAVNTRLLLPGRLEGIGWFTYQCFKRIVKENPEHQFYFLFDRPYSSEFVFGPNVEPVRLFPQARHPFLYYLYFEYAVARVLKRKSVDLFVSPDGFLSLRFNGRQLPVFHDLNFMHNPGFLPFMTGKYYTHFFPKYARKAERIVTVSGYSKKDINATFGYPQDKIDVVYNGVHDVFSPVGDEVVKSTRDLFSGGRPYFVYIGALHRRKNIENMLRAFDRFRDTDKIGHKLLLVGAPMFGSSDLGRIYRSMRYRDDVIFVGRLYGKALRNVMASSTALLLVSHFEGFGVPIIEAMQCDVPVIASNVTSMPEVAGDAALYVEPCSENSISSAMNKIVDDKELRRVLVEKGRSQREKFSWDKTAGLLWESMKKCM